MKKEEKAVVSSNKNDFTDEKSRLGYEIEKIIYYETNLNHEETPGFVIGIIKDDSTYFYEYGHTDFNEHTRINKSHIFEIGGISKIYSAALVQVLQDKNLISYTETVAQILDLKEPSEHAQKTTILDLVTHTSGLPMLPFGFGIRQKDAQNPYVNYSKKMLIDSYLEFSNQYSNDKKYTYSDYNYALLEILIEKKLKMSWHELFAKYIATPAEFKATGLQPELTATSGFNRTGNKAPNWEFSSFAASVGVKTNATEAINFLNLHLDDSHKLSKSIQKITEPYLQLEEKEEAYVAKGWHVLVPNSYHQILTHTGFTAGHRAYMGLIKKTKTGVVILSNSEVELDSLGLLILRHLNNYWKAN